MFEEIKERGRWQSSSSLRTYLDIVGAADVATGMRLQGFGPALAWAHSRWHTYFTTEVLEATYRGGTASSAAHQLAM